MHGFSRMMASLWTPVSRGVALTDIRPCNPPVFLTAGWNSPCYGNSNSGFSRSSSVSIVSR